MIRIPRQFGDLSGALLGIKGCDPLNVKRGQACFFWACMTARIDELLIICQQREALGTPSPAME